MLTDELNEIIKNNQKESEIFFQKQYNIWLNEQFKRLKDNIKYNVKNYKYTTLDDGRKLIEDTSNIFHFYWINDVPIKEGKYDLYEVDNKKNCRTLCCKLIEEELSGGIINWKYTVNLTPVGKMFINDFINLAKKEKIDISEFYASIEVPSNVVSLNGRKKINLGECYKLKSVHQNNSLILKFKYRIYF